MLRAQEVWQERKSCGDVVGTARKRKAVTMEIKVKTIEILDQSDKMVNITHSYNVNGSTTILKNKNKITEPVKSAVPVKSTTISTKCGKVTEEMEGILTISISVESQSA